MTTTIIGSYDIAIVGGGPAGLSAAYKASKLGANVILFEKDDSIAHNIRTSGVTWIEDIEKLGISKDHYNPIKNYSLLSSSNEATIRGESAKSCVLNVRTTYQFLAFLAAEAGTEIMVRSNVTNVITDTKNRVLGLKVNTPKGDLIINCKLVIDASGFSSSVGRRLRMVNEWKRYGVGAEYECYCEHADPETWTLMVGSQYSDVGYAWVFPLSKNRIRIGVGVGRPESNMDPMQNLHWIIEKKLKPLDRLGKIQPIELHYGFIPNEGLRESSVSDGFILVGDSAGQSNPLVLEGIRYAIEFGRLAGEIGARSLSKDSEKASLIEYEQIVRKRIESKIKAALKVQARWIGLSDDEWNKEIDILRDLSIDEFLDFIKAEFTTAKMMRLALNHPKLAARQLFNIVLKH
ncbi:MAG TPA: NAD(P)/FAD-dependent oxidoreductase [Nitrososphaeraceae archaeon]|jgi:digeranylgeranylglycerophospholipid reductase|nr:NAD(P)/FAD-dependent oxidoreductase [Nitrososphaeraceae archaeon]